MDELSVIEADPEACGAEANDETVFDIVVKRSERGRDIDNKEYQYNRQRTRGATVGWRCCVRNRMVTCIATLRQR